MLPIESVHPKKGGSSFKFMLKQFRVQDRFTKFYSKQVYNLKIKNNNEEFLVSTKLTTFPH